jgi:hypothetical protein
MKQRIGSLLVFVLVAIASGVSPAIAANKPNAPANISVTSNSAANAATSAGSLSVTWQRPETDTAHPLPIAYIVTATAGAQSVSVPVSMATVATIDYSTVVTGLTGGTAYAVTVTSVSSNQENQVSPAITATPITSPASPTANTPVASPGSVALTWIAPTNNGGSAITGYSIKDKDVGGTVTSITDPATATKTFNGLAASSEATYWIRANNANGSSPWQAFTPVTLPSAPDKPTSITASPGTNSITVSWAAPVNTGNSAITGYKVYLYNSGGTAVGNPTSTTSTTTEITNVTSGAYTVKVVASNLVGDSALSDASDSVTIAPPSALQANAPVFNPSTLSNLVIGGTQSVSATVPSTGVVTITAIGTPTGACTYANGIVTAVARELARYV